MAAARMPHRVWRPGVAREPAEDESVRLRLDADRIEHPGHGDGEDGHRAPGGNRVVRAARLEGGDARALRVRVEQGTRKALAVEDDAETVVPHGEDLDSNPVDRLGHGGLHPGADPAALGIVDAPRLEVLDGPAAVERHEAPAPGDLVLSQGIVDPDRLEHTPADLVRGVGGVVAEEAKVPGAGADRQALDCWDHPPEGPATRQAIQGRRPRRLQLGHRVVRGPEPGDAIEHDEGDLPFALADDGLEDFEVPAAVHVRRGLGRGLGTAGKARGRTRFRCGRGRSGCSPAPSGVRRGRRGRPGARRSCTAGRATPSPRGSRR